MINRSRSVSYEIRRDGTGRDDPDGGRVTTIGGSVHGSRGYPPIQTNRRRGIPRPQKPGTCVVTYASATPRNNVHLIRIHTIRSVFERIERVVEGSPIFRKIIHGKKGESYRREESLILFEKRVDVTIEQF